MNNILEKSFLEDFIKTIMNELAKFNTEGNLKVISTPLSKAIACGSSCVNSTNYLACMIKCSSKND